MPIGLPVERVINISISLTPQAAQFENFDSLLILGDSDVIDTQQRLRSYSGIAGVATDFGTTAPEYLAALPFFSQTPEPDQLFIGRWAKTATNGHLVCGVLSGAEQILSNWTAITDGAFTVSIDSGVATHGTNTGAALNSSEILISNWNIINNGAFTININSGGASNVTGLDFTGAFFLSDVAGIIQTALNGVVSGTTCTWNGITSKFQITAGGAAGASSTVSYLTTEGTGTDISGMLLMRTGQGTLVNGVASGGASNITGLDFHLQTNLNGVASVIQTALNSAVSGTTCVWNGTYGYFEITAPITGTGSSISFLTTEGAGTDISALLKGTAATAQYSVNGIAAESALAAVTILDNEPTQWYALNFAAGTNNADVSDSDYLAVAAYIEASGISSGNPHFFGITTSDANALNSSSSADIGAELMAAGYQRSFVQFSSTNAYASTSIFGLLLTVDYTANNTTLDIMWKMEPGITPETLQVSQANTLDSKRYNYFVRFNNNSSIIVNGWCSGPVYIDETINMDAFANRLQTDLYNLMITTPTKIPQTDPGVHQLTTTAEGSCAAFVNNGFLAPGTWNSTGFGALQTGDFMSKGYYVYAPPIALQAVADRDARKSPTIQIAGKEAGAINEVIVNAIINR